MLLRPLSSRRLSSAGRLSSNRHKPVLPVTTPLPIFPDRSTLLLVCQSRPVTAAGLGPNLKRYFPPTGNIPKLRGRIQGHAAGFCPLLAPVPCLYPYPITECLNPVGVIFPTILPTIRTTKALFLLPMHRTCLTLQATKSAHDSQHKFEAKPGSFADLSPQTRLCCTPNQMIMKRAHFRD